MFVHAVARTVRLVAIVSHCSWWSGLVAGRQL